MLENEFMSFWIFQIEICGVFAVVIACIPVIIPNLFYRSGTVSQFILFVGLPNSTPCSDAGTWSSTHWNSSLGSEMEIDQKQQRFILKDSSEFLFPLGQDPVTNSINK